MDYLNNYTFINEAAFHINIKRIGACSNIGNCVDVVDLKTRAMTTTIIWVISPYDVINVKVGGPEATHQSKRTNVKGGKPNNDTEQSTSEK